MFFTGLNWVKPLPSLITQGVKEMSHTSWPDWPGLPHLTPKFKVKVSWRVHTSGANWTASSHLSDIWSFEQNNSHECESFFFTVHQLIYIQCHISSGYIISPLLGQSSSLLMKASCREVETSWDRLLLVVSNHLMSRATIHSSCHTALRATTYSMHVWGQAKKWIVRSTS